MGNKRSKTRRPKQGKAGKKGGAANFDDPGSPQPVRKKRKKQ